MSRFKTELFIAHFHLRLIGYTCLALLVLAIVVGFATRRAGLAAVGAVGFMLPVFAQFAGVMFFLAGLGLLNVGVFKCPQKDAGEHSKRPPASRVVGVGVRLALFRHSPAKRQLVSNPLHLRVFSPRSVTGAAHQPHQCQAVGVTHTL